MSKPNKPKPITVKAAIAYAEQLEQEAQKQIVADPDAAPYRPPSEAGVRKLCQRKGTPEGAIDYMRARAAMCQREARENAETARAALTRHSQRQGKHLRKRNEARDHMSEGTRIDQAIARLSIVGSPAAMQLAGDTVHGGEPNRLPAFTVDAAAKARHIARKARTEIEALEDSLTLRDMNQAA